MSAHLPGASGPASPALLAMEPSLIRVLRDEARPTSLDLGLGQPDLAVPALLREALVQIATEGRGDYSPNTGLPEAREAVALREGCDPAEVILTCGVQQGLALVILGMVGPGDEVLVPDPGFPAYANLVRAAGAVPVPYRLVWPGLAEGWQVDLEAFAGALGAKTRLAILNSPSNPTGAVIPGATLEAMLGMLEARGIAWLSDEIYEDYIWQGLHTSPRDIACSREGGVKLGGLSKSQHMMGWRLGWAVGPRAWMDRLKPLHQHLVTCAPTLVQRLVPLALAHHEALFAPTRACFARRRALAVQACQGLAGVAHAAPQGAFYLFVSAPEAVARQGSSLALARDILREVDVVTIPGEGFGGEGQGFLRLAYTLDEALLARAFARLGDYFEGRA